MPGVIHHRIRKQSLLVGAATTADAFAIRRYLRSEWEESLRPAMEQAFDGADRPGCVTHIPRIELVLRVPSVKDLAEMLPELIRRGLAGRLRELAGSGGGDIDGAWPPHAGAGSDAALELSEEEDRFAMALHYLRTGMLPWRAASLADERTAEMLRAICRDNALRLAALLCHGGMPGPDLTPFLFRLLQLLGAEEGRGFIRLLFNDVPDAGNSGVASVAEMIAVEEGRATSRHDYLRFAAVLIARVLCRSESAAGGVVLADTTPVPAPKAQPAAGEKREGEAPGTTVGNGTGAHDAASPGRTAGHAAGPGSEMPAGASYKASMPDDERRWETGTGAAGDEDAGGDPAAWSAATLALIRLLPSLMEGADPDARWPESIWRERLAAASRGTPDGAERRERLRITAALLAEHLRHAGAGLYSGEGASLLAHTLEAMPGDEMRRFVHTLAGYMPAALPDDPASVIDLLVGDDADSLRRDRRILLAAALLIEGLRHAGGGTVPGFGMIVRRHSTPGERAALLALLNVRAPAAAMSLRLAVREEDRGQPAVSDGRDAAGDAAQHTPGGMVAAILPGAVPDAPAPGAMYLHMEEVCLPLTVQHAGLVLLHSFIPHFFSNIGALGSECRDLPDPLLPRAAALLGLLATGRDEIFEYELGFCKVLLGRQPDTPVLLSEGLIGPGDIAEAGALLGAVIDHWSALRSTSAEVLREAFLQRRGLLRRGEKGWRLQVEPAPYDMLLLQLPWGISIVSLPWMPEPIYVEWERP